MNPDPPSPIARPYRYEATDSLGRIAHQGTLTARTAAIAELVTRARQARDAAASATEIEAKIQNAKSTGYYAGQRAERRVQAQRLEMLAADIRSRS